MSAFGAFLIEKYLGTVLILGRCLKKDGAYFKVKEANYINFQNFDIVFFQYLNTLQQTKRYENIEM